MTLYEIEYAITQLIDPETGEICDYEVFESLNMERESKIENMALWVKNLRAEEKAIADEIATLKKRKESSGKKADKLESYIAEILGGDKWSSPKVAITFRNTKSVQVQDGFVDWAITNADHLLTYKAPEPSKTAIKEYLADHECEFAHIVENKSMTIK